MRLPRPWWCACLFVGCVEYDVHREEGQDSFVQPAREGGVDVLWVVDDSYSMAEEQEQLALHGETFVSFLSTVAVDFRLAVTRTDLEVDRPGALLGDVLDSDTPNLASAFAGQLTLSSGGSRDERGFDAALLALDPAGVNGDFSRSDADAEIVFFSDEDDHSALSTDEFIAALGDVHGGAVVVNGIVGDPPEGCASLLAAADPGERYIAAQEATGGLRESICASDYDAVMERMALKVLGLDTAFALSKLPELSTVEVRVNEALVHRRDRHGWRYDAGDNTIVFDGYAVPPPGAEIVIVYAEWHGGGDTGE